MTAPAVPDVDVSRELLDQVRPPCDAVVVEYSADGRVLSHEHCLDPASYVVSTRCTCGHVEVDLLCTRHLEQLPGLGFWCLRCKTANQIAATTVEAL